MEVLDGVLVDDGVTVLVLDCELVLLEVEVGVLV